MGEPRVMLEVPLRNPVAPGPSTVPWVTETMQRARYQSARPYKGVSGGLDQLVEEGRIALRPAGLRIMLRAVLQNDANEIEGWVHTAYDARDAICFEVLAVSPAVDVWYDQQGVPDDARDKRGIIKRLRAFFSGRGAVRGSRPRPGDHLWMASVDADRLSGTDPACRLWCAHPEDCPVSWERPAVD